VLARNALPLSCLSYRRKVAKFRNKYD